MSTKKSIPNKGVDHGGKIEKGINESKLPKYETPPPPPPPLTKKIDKK